MPTKQQFTSRCSTCLTIRPARMDGAEYIVAEHDVTYAVSSASSKKHTVTMLCAGSNEPGEALQPKHYMPCFVCGNRTPVEYDRERNVYQIYLHPIDEKMYDRHHENPVYCEASDGVLPAQFVESPRAVQRKNYLKKE